MIYSRWRPDKGGFDYFETPERFGMGDDLPTPSLPMGTALGVSSVLAGRVPRSSPLTPVGHGKEARGMIMPTSREGLQGVGALSTLSTWSLLAVGAASGFFGYYFLGRKKP